MSTTQTTLPNPIAGHQEMPNSPASRLLERDDCAEEQPLASTPSESTNEAKQSQDRPQRSAGIAPKKSEPLLRYRKTPFWLLVVYLTTLIVPWVLTCILDVRPLTSSSYYEQTGSVGLEEYLAFLGVLALVNALKTLSGVLTIPVTSAIIAYAAVVYAQKRHENQKLSVTQLFALSDRAWADITLMWRAESSGRGSPLLWYGALLVLIGSVQQPLQSILVTIEPIIAMSCADLPRGGCGSNAVRIGYDADPWAMAELEHNLVVQDVSSSLATFSNIESQVALWPDHPYGDDEGAPVANSADMTLLRFYAHGDDGKKEFQNASYFVTSLPRDTRTGVLRQHALRLNSSTTCQIVPQSDFPDVCNGSRPLSVEIRRQHVNISVCAPGEIGHHPWTLSRNRQDIEEELFIDFQFRKDTEGLDPVFSAENFTIHCTASTTRGYFELGNFMNNDKYGTLLDTWPDNQTIQRDFNDYLPDGSRPVEVNADHQTTDNLPGWWTSLPFARPTFDSFYTGQISVSGPLMTVANVLFGNTSFLQTVYTNSAVMSPNETLSTMCAHGNIPFSQVLGIAIFSGEKPPNACYGAAARASLSDNAKVDNLQIDKVLASWMQLFLIPHEAGDLLDMSLFVANRATLQKTVTGAGELHARQIYYSGGTLFGKPTKNLASTIVISIFIFVQSIGLSVLVWYARRVPTWTNTFNSMAVAQLGRALGETDIPPIGPVSEKDRVRLRKVNALVGVVDNDDRSEQGSCDVNSLQDPKGVKLALGGTEFITREHCPKKQKGRKSKT